MSAHPRKRRLSQRQRAREGFTVPSVALKEVCPQRRRAREGFTLLEVMMALAVLTVGSLGLLSLQRASIRGNSHAREVTIATQLNRTWLERVRRDALGWNSSAISAISGTAILRNLPLGPGSSGWFYPDSPALGEGAADWYGRASSAAEGRFCTNLNLSWVVPGALARVDVRTWWFKAGEWNASLDECAGGQAAPVTAALAAEVPAIHAAHSSTTVRWTRMVE